MVLINMLQGYFGKFEEGFSLIVDAHIKMQKIY